MELLNPPIEQLVTEIVAVNRAWKAAKETFPEPASPLANSLRNLKNRLQVRLLRDFAPKKVYLVEEVGTVGDEPLYSLLLTESIGNWTDAAHIPVRVAQANLSAEEIQRYLRSHNTHINH